jgi:hypothetical protein
MMDYFCGTVFGAFFAGVIWVIVQQLAVVPHSKPCQQPEPPQSYKPLRYGCELTIRQIDIEDWRIEARWADTKDTLTIDLATDVAPTAVGYLMQIADKARADRDKALAGRTGN